jgi:hypothetical protein
VDIKGNLDAIIQGLSRVDEGIILSCYYRMAFLTCTEKKRVELGKWLAAPNYSLNHRAALKRRRLVTGGWFLNSQEYANWKIHYGLTIWLHGIRK